MSSGIREPAQNPAIPPKKLKPPPGLGTQDALDVPKNEKPMSGSVSEPEVVVPMVVVENELVADPNTNESFPQTR